MMVVRNKFEQELEDLNQEIIKMANFVNKAIQNSMEALQNHDVELAKKVIKDDKKADEMDRRIGVDCLRLLMMQQPVAKDLRAISTILRMTTDLERIGDQAADIAEISMSFQTKEFIKELVHIPKMGEIVVEMVSQSIDAFIKEDMDLAKAVIDRDDEVDDLFEVVKKELVEVISENKDNGDEAIELMMIAKYLERIGDHAVNLGEWLIFYKTGEIKDKPGI